jgi:glutamate N-acetyltransferase / amino-acid N-acetyltransferase
MVASTGVIGLPLPMDIIIPGIKECCDTLSVAGGPAAAEAIMTTDTFGKKITIEFELSGKTATISGIAKGSGMIHPNMGTMLGFVLTDVAISKGMLAKALSDSVEDSFNMVSVDGDTSTNDTVVVIANGACENPIIDKENSDYISFKEALDFVNKELSKQIAKDGEGATKLVEVNLSGARTKEDAKILAKSIITSSLVKAAMFGSDANWGRIFCALGYSTGKFEPMKVEISFKSEDEEIMVAKDGFGLNFDEDKAKKILDKDKVNIIVNLYDGNYNATAWGCDLTYDYVKINGSYRT